MGAKVPVRERGEPGEASGCAWWWWVFGLLVALIVVWVMWGVFSGDGPPPGAPGPIGPMNHGL